MNEKGKRERDAVSNRHVKRKILSNANYVVGTFADAKGPTPLLGH